MSRAEALSTVAIAGIVVWVRVVTGRGMLEIVYDHLPRLLD